MTITIVEVGPRDGLQNEAVVVDTHTKVEFINRCVAAGVQRIEAASFVNPKRVPQMADGEAVLERLTPDAASYIGLVLNERGFDRAVNTQVDEVNLVVMVTDTFSQKNQGMTTQEAMAAVAAIAPRAKQAGLPVSVTLSASFGCPYEGEVAVSRLVDVATQVADAGIDELAIADTIGVAVPRDVQRRLSAVADAVDVPLRVHVHNTRNTGYASALAAADAGVGIDIASIGAGYRRLAEQADRVLVEGVGGWHVPLSERQMLQQLVVALNLPVILVVGLRLGCINHALLTCDAIVAAGCQLAGWVANRTDPQMTAVEGNLQTLRDRIGAPLLGVVPYMLEPDIRRLAVALDPAPLERLPEGG